MKESGLNNSKEKEMEIIFQFPFKHRITATYEQNLIYFTISM